MQSGRTTVTIRGVDKALWIRLRQEAVQREIPAGAMFNLLLAEHYGNWREDQHGHGDYSGTNGNDRGPAQGGEA